MCVHVFQCTCVRHYYCTSASAFSNIHTCRLEVPEQAQGGIPLGFGIVYKLEVPEAYKMLLSFSEILLTNANLKVQWQKRLFNPRD